MGGNNLTQHNLDARFCRRVTIFQVQFPPATPVRSNVAVFVEVFLRVLPAMQMFDV